MKRKLLCTALALGVFAPPGMAESRYPITGQEYIPVTLWRNTKNSPPVTAEEVLPTCQAMVAAANADAQAKGHPPSYMHVVHSLEFISKPGTLYYWDYRCNTALQTQPDKINGGIEFSPYCQVGRLTNAGTCVIEEPTCPSEGNWTLSADKKRCTRPDAKEFINAGPGSCNQKQQFIGNPINSATGNKVETQTDLSIPGAPELNFTRTYNSRYLPTDKAIYPWLSRFQQYVQYNSINGTYDFYRPTGEIQTFIKNGSVWQARTSTVDTLTELKDAKGLRIGWQYQVAADGSKEQYDAQGKLQSLTALNGKTVTLSYSDGSQKAVSDASGQVSELSLPVGLLIKATNQFGQSLQFTYNERFQLKQVSGPDDKTVSYRYGDIKYDKIKGLLTSVTQPDGSTRQYLYESAYNPAFLTGILNELGQRTLTVSYDDQGRATSTEHAGGVNKYQVVYQTDGSAKVTDPLGTVRTYGFGNYNGAIKTTELSQPCPTGCGNSGKQTRYDAQGNATRIVDWNGTATEYAYDTTRGLELRRTEGLKDEAGVSVVQPETRTVVTTWHSTLPLPLTVSEYTGGVNASGQPSGTLQKQTTYTYDSQGNQLTRTEQSGSDSRQWQRQYTSLGRVTSVTEPDGSNVQYSYYADDDSDLGKRGQLKQASNSAGHITQISAYNADGQPTRLIDPNGKTSEYSYDTRGRVTSKQSGGQRVSYSYDAAGRLTKAEANDGTRLDYGYDNAGRLTSVSDQKGNRIAYVLDNLGNRTSETVSGPGGDKLKQIERQYNPLNQLKQLSGNE